MAAHRARLAHGVKAPSVLDKAAILTHPYVLKLAKSKCRLNHVLKAFSGQSSYRPRTNTTYWGTQMNRYLLGAAQFRRALLVLSACVGLAAAGAANAVLTFTPTPLTVTAVIGSPGTSASVTARSTVALFKVSLAVAGTGYALSSNTCGTTAAPISLAANGTCTFTVTYTATATTATTATVTLSAATTATGAAAAQTPTLPVTGTGTAAITATPATLTFATAAGTPSTAQAVTFKNNGTATLAGVAVVAPAAPFTATTTCATTLLGGGTCAVNVTYSPTAAGTNTGTVGLSATGQTTATATLSGTASTPVPAWEYTNTLGTQTALFMAGPPMRYPGTTGVTGCGNTAATGGAYVHTAQGGDLCAFASANYAFSYDSTTTGTAYGDYYIYQAAAGAAYNKTTDYFGFSILAPYANANAAIAPIVITNSKAVLIKLANMVTPSTTNGTANVVTVTLKNQDVTGTWPASNPAACSTDVTLLTGATGTANGPGVASFAGTYLGQATGTYVSQTGLLDYAIPFTAFTCQTNDLGTGAATTMAALQATGVTQVAVKIVGSKNAKVVAGSIDAISVGGISFQ